LGPPRCEKKTVNKEHHTRCFRKDDRGCKTLKKKKKSSQGRGGKKGTKKSDLSNLGEIKGTERGDKKSNYWIEQCGVKKVEGKQEGFQMIKFIKTIGGSRENAKIRAKLRG